MQQNIVSLLSRLHLRRCLHCGADGVVEEAHADIEVVAHLKADAAVDGGGVDDHVCARPHYVDVLAVPGVVARVEYDVFGVAEPAPVFEIDLLRLGLAHARAYDALVLGEHLRDELPGLFDIARVLHAVLAPALVLVVDEVRRLPCVLFEDIEAMLIQVAIHRHDAVGALYQIEEGLLGHDGLAVVAVHLVAYRVDLVQNEDELVLAASFEAFDASQRLVLDDEELVFE